MKKIWLIGLLFISSVIHAADHNKEVIEQYLKRSLSQELAKNPSIKAKVEYIRFLSQKQVDKDWTGYYVSMKLKIMENGQGRTTFVRSPLFTNGKMVTDDLSTPLGGQISTELVPTIPSGMYDAEHYVAGNKNALHRLVLFTDPLCPSCRMVMPRILKKVRDNPSKYVLYVYHYPLESIHPESAGIVKGMIALWRSGKRDVFDRVYSEDIASSSDLNRMYGGFKISKKDIAQYKKDLEKTELLAVAGTPYLYFDGVMDSHGRKFFNIVK